MKQKRKQDLELAQKICVELKKGNRKAIEVIWKKYNQSLINLCKNKFEDSFLKLGTDCEGFVTDLWCEIIENTDIICKFKGDSYLKTYLNKVFFYKAMTLLSLKKTEYLFETRLFSELTTETNEDDLDFDKVLLKKANKSLPENLHSFTLATALQTRELIQKIIRKSLKRLSVKRSEEAHLLAARILKGLTYEEFVEKKYVVENAKEKQRIINRLKKRFERVKDTFKKEITRSLEEEGMDIQDLWTKLEGL